MTGHFYFACENCDLDLKEQLFENYDRRHPWETTRFDFFSNLAKQNVHVTSPRIIDCGAGDCWFSLNLADRLSVPNSSSPKLTLVDINFSPETIEKIQKAYGKTANYKFVTTLPAEVADLVLMLDVLEHIEDEESFLKDVVRKTFDKNTVAIISVPAIEMLFGKHDEILGHYRRYSSKRIFDVLKKANLKVKDSGFLFPTLVPFRILSNLFSAGKTNTDLIPPRSAFVAATMKNILKFDMSMQKKTGFRLPGLTWWAICQKSDHV